MAEQDDSKTIYISPELVQANKNRPTESHAPEIHAPVVKPLSSHRIYLGAADRGLRRSFGSTNLLSHPSLACDSAESLEGAVLLHSDSSGEYRRGEKFGSDSDITTKSRESSGLSLNELSQLDAGEGRGSSHKKTGLGSTDEQERGPLEANSEKNEAEENNRKWADASVTEESRVEARKAKGKQRKGEEEEESVSALPFFNYADMKHRIMTSDSEDLRAPQGTCTLTKSLAAEFTHCLFMLEEECRGVEKESEDVKWKMEVIHSSMQCVQETLRTLLIRLVEAQSSERVSQDSAPEMAVPQPPPIQKHHDADHCHHHAHPHAHPHTHQPHHHAHGKAPHPVPSKTCLTEALKSCDCCQSVDLPSCSQRAKERAAAFSAITDLRADVERLRLSQVEERREQREALQALKAFQRQVEELLHVQGSAAGRPQPGEQRQEQGSSNQQLSAQLHQLKQEVQEVAHMTRDAMAVLEKLGNQLQNMATQAPPQCKQHDS